MYVFIPSIIHVIIHLSIYSYIHSCLQLYSIVFQVFEGNKDRNSVKKHVLEPSIIGHRIRIYQHEDTQSFTGSSVCLRAEFYGCNFYSGTCSHMCKPYVKRVAYDMLT